MANLSLFQAIFWAVVGGLLYFYHVSNDNALDRPMFGTGVPQYWLIGLAGLFVFWNLLRWWSARSYRANQQVSGSVLEAHRRRDEAERGRRPEQPPDPNFDFSKKPKEGQN